MRMHKPIWKKLLFFLVTFHVIIGQKSYAQSSDTIQTENSLEEVQALLGNENQLPLLYQYPVRIIPKTPEAAAMDKFIEFPAIGGTGIPDITIPLYTLQFRDFTLPLSISYHASGIRVNDIATSVGLNWVLNAGGAINRDIIGLVDEGPSGWFSFDSVAVSSCNFQVLEPYYEGLKDVAPDLFSFTIPSKNGKFIFRRDMNIRQTVDDVKISYNNSLNDFTIWDAQGYKYSFIPKDSSSIVILDNNVAQPNLNGKGLVGWKLDKITLPTGEMISFTYTKYNYNTSNYLTSKYYTRLGDDLECGVSAQILNGESSTQIFNTVFLIETITTPTEKVKFEYTDDSQLSSMKRKLGKISVLNNYNDTLQIIKFIHDKYSGDARLKLTGVNFYGNSYITNINNPKKYSFTYNTGSLPVMGSYAQDIFGYYNTNTVSHMIPVSSANQTNFPPTNVANREVSTSNISVGILSEIKYPTGGKTKFTFEANIVGTKAAPGLRVKQIELINSDGSVAEKKQYAYSNLTGYVHTANNYDYYYVLHQKNTGNPGRFREEKRWTSTPISYISGNFGRYSGFCYGEVRTNFMNGSTIGYYTVEKYNSTTDMFTVIPYLTERWHKNNSDKFVRKEIYNYSLTSYSYNGWIPAHSYETHGDNCNGFPPMYCETLTAYTPLMTYAYFINKLSLTKKSETDCFNNETQSVSKITEYEYNKYRLPKKIKESTSIPGKKNETLIYYPDDYGNGTNTSWITPLKDAAMHMVGVPIDKRVYLRDTIAPSNDKLISGEQVKYNQYGQPTDFYKFESTASDIAFNATIPLTFTLKHSIEYNTTTKRPTKAYNIGDMYTHYIWGYNSQYPIAQIVTPLSTAINVPITETSLTRSDISSNVLITVNYLKGQLNSYLNNVDYQVTIFTHKPQVGISSQTDPTGITTFYQYDSFGRLGLSRNHDQNLLKKYEYNYSGQ